MRHLHFTQSLEPLQGGGLGTSTSALHRRMLIQGLDSRLCATFSREPQRSAEQTFEFRRLGPEFLYWAPQLSARAEELVKASDVVHGHGLYVGPNQAFGQAARRNAKPLVYHVHGMFEPYILRRSRWKKQLAHWLFEDANFENARLWRALTVKEADQIRACGIRAPIVIAPNGLDLEQFAKPQPPDDGPHLDRITAAKQRSRLVFLGRLHPKKGLDLLLCAWARLIRFHKDWELIIAGPDEKGYLAQLQKLVENLELGESVRFLGSVVGSGKRALLHSADLFVLPSYSEGFPMSLLEAMACAVPVVATTACNFSEISQHQAGWECEAFVPSVVHALESGLHADASERRQRGLRGQRLVEENYSWQLIIEKILEACQQHCQ